MELLEKLRLLSQHIDLEPTSANNRSAKNITCREIYMQDAVLPNGKRMRLLKSLLSSNCINDCAYCPFRAGRDFRRTSFSPEEYALLISNLYHAGLIQGAFISSAITGNNIRVQDRLIETAEILRSKFQYHGYLHVKIMPGAEDDQIEHIMQLADRVSLNLEAPNKNRLAFLAPSKEFDSHLLSRLYKVEMIRKTKPSWQGWKKHWPSLSTQFVVGGADESDKEILETTDMLFKEVRLKRAYFSSFRPFDDTPLANHPPIPYKREYRLYQASYLLRDYGYTMQDLTFTQSDDLPLDTDPKKAWADRNLVESPLEINRAEKHELLRIPGVGPKTAERIILVRKNSRISDISTLSKLGINTKNAMPYILINGKKQIGQLPLFSL